MQRCCTERTSPCFPRAGELSRWCARVSLPPPAGAARAPHSAGASGRQAPAGLHVHMCAGHPDCSEPRRHGVPPAGVGQWLPYQQNEFQKEKSLAMKPTSVTPPERPAGSASQDGEGAGPGRGTKLAPPAGERPRRQWPLSPPGPPAGASGPKEHALPRKRRIQRLAPAITFSSLAKVHFASVHNLPARTGPRAPARPGPHSEGLQGVDRRLRLGAEWQWDGLDTWIWALTAGRPGTPAPTWPWAPAPSGSLGHLRAETLRPEPSRLLFFIP